MISFAKAFTIKLYQGLNVPNLAHGKMYKRFTFGRILPFTPESFRVLNQKITNYEEAGK